MYKNLAFLTLILGLSSPPGFSADSEPLVSGQTSGKPLEKPMQDYFPGNIYWKLALALGTATQGNPFNPVESEKRLTELTHGHSLSFKLTLSPKGKIVDVEVLKSSGSEQIDQKLKDLITSAGPFAPNALTNKDRSYQINLPKLHAVPMWLYGNKIRPVD